MSDKEIKAPTGALAGLAAWTTIDDEALRRAWSVGGNKAARAALPDRSSAAIYHRRKKLGLEKRCVQWSVVDDGRLRRLWDGSIDLHEIAARIGRSEQVCWRRARDLGLQLGVPPGYEYLSRAAERTGYDISQLRPILRWAEVPIRCALARPTKDRGWRRHFVDPFDVDDAIERWLKTESASSAARRHGVSPQTIRRKIIDAGLDRDRKPNQHLRVGAAELSAIGYASTASGTSS